MAYRDKRPGSDPDLARIGLHHCVKNSGLTCLKSSESPVAPTSFFFMHLSDAYAGNHLHCGSDGIHAHGGRAHACICYEYACPHGQLMGGTLSGHLMHQPARSRQLVANGVAARTGAGESHTLRMDHRANRSDITGITDRRQGPDRIAPRRGAAISPPKPYLTEKVTLPKHRALSFLSCPVLLGAFGR